MALAQTEKDGFTSLSLPALFSPLSPYSGMAEYSSSLLPLDGLEEFQGDLIQKDSHQYRQAISRWANNAEREARMVAFPKDSTDVSRIVKFAAMHGIPIAVKGGGHSASGASSVADGVVIDLSRYLDHVRIDSDKGLGSVGGGAVWRTVDEEAIKQGLATVGGTVNHVCFAARDQVVSTDEGYRQELGVLLSAVDMGGSVAAMASLQITFAGYVQ